MKFIFLLLLIVSFIPAFATAQLQRNYYVKNHYVLLSDIFPNTKHDVRILQMQPNKHIVRIQEKKLLEILKQYGYQEIKHTYPYIQFTQKSPIDTKPLVQKVYELYSKSYSSIAIEKILVYPRSYISKLPNNYSVHFPKKAQLSNKIIFSIETPQRKKIFFNALIFAHINVLIAREKIHKGDALSNVNTKKKSIMLQKFSSHPLERVQNGRYQAKHNIKKGKILTQRDVVSQVYIHRGATVSITLKNNGIFINFSAKAIQNGRLGEIIKVRNENGKTLRVRVLGHNIAEVI